MMAITLAQLRALSDEEVEARYDESTRHTQVGLSFWEDELDRRSRDRLVKSNQKLARWSLAVATLSGLASIAAVVLSVVTLLGSGA